MTRTQGGSRSEPSALRSTIAAIQTATVSLAASPDLAVHSARGSHERSDFVLVRILTDDGAVGHGEISATALWSGEDGVTATHIVRDVLAPALIGQPLWPVARLTTLMDTVVANNWFTKAGVNMALWDALGRTLDVPVTVLLGGPFRTTVPVKMSLSGNGASLRASHAAIFERGFRSFKVKVGLNVDEDIARFALARELVGEGAFLGADANGGWTRLEAHRAIPRLHELGADFIEQPVAPEDIDGLAELRRLGVPVLADESAFSLRDVAQIIRREAADAVSLYVGKSGALERAVLAGRMLGVFGIGVLIGSNGEMGVGAAAQVHVACAIEGLADIPSDIIGHHYYDEHTLESPVTIDGLHAHLPLGPGLGVEPKGSISQRFA